MNVFDNVAFPLRQNTDKSEEEIAEIVHHRMAEVGLSHAEKRMPNELSGGMRKRAGFARAGAQARDSDVRQADSGVDRSPPHCSAS
jgi:phospholipid/cholesterol/gamma-HCH transport system ATP-binding protein